MQLPYLTAVCHETLRLSPIATLTVPREVKDPVELMGYQLEPGTRLYGCIYLTHQRPDLYPEPKLFKPERFFRTAVFCLRISCLSVVVRVVALGKH